MPFDRKNRQSSSCWFQRASVDSTSPAGASSRPRRAMAISVAAIADLEIGGLAEARHVPLHPVSGPLDQLLGIDDRKAEQFDRQRRIGQPRRRLFLDDENGSLSEMLAELGGKV